MERDVIRHCRPLGVVGLVAGIRSADRCDRATGETFVIVPPGKGIAGLLNVRRQLSALAIGVIINIAAIYRSAVSMECDGVGVGEQFGFPAVQCHIIACPIREETAQVTTIKSAGEHSGGCHAYSYGRAC